MIPDGYTVTKDFFGVTVEYRPMLLPERLAVYRRANAVADGLRDAVYAEACRPHIVWPSGEVDLSKPLMLAIINPKADENADCDNLYHGTILQQKYPRMVDCGTCQQWSVNPLTSQFQTRGGNRVRRQAPDDLLCRTKEGCPKGSPESPFGLSPKNRQALAFDLECRAVGQWPDDPIVRRNARVIGLALMEVQRA